MLNFVTIIQLSVVLISRGLRKCTLAFGFGRQCTYTKQAVRFPPAYPLTYKLFDRGIPL